MQIIALHQQIAAFRIGHKRAIYPPAKPGTALWAL